MWFQILVVVGLAWISLGIYDIVRTLGLINERLIEIRDRAASIDARG